MLARRAHVPQLPVLGSAFNMSSYVIFTATKTGTEADGHKLIICPMGMAKSRQFFQTGQGF
jgi:hypothetical protein